MTEPIHLVVLDTETSGLKPHRGDCIIEIAAQHVILDHDSRRLYAARGDGVFDGFGGFHTRVVPSKAVPEDVAKINGYNDADWKDAAMPEVAAELFVRWIFEKLPGDGYTWCGSNVQGFDLPFVRNLLRKSGWTLPAKPKFSRRTLNTESLCFPLLAIGKVDSCGVAALRKWAGLQGEQRHNAVADVMDTVHIIRTYFERQVWGV